MEVDRCSQLQNSQQNMVEFFKSYNLNNSDKRALIDNLNQFKKLIFEISADSIEDQLLQYMMPSVRKLLEELYGENDSEKNITTEEQQKYMVENLNICVLLVDCIGAISSVISSETGRTDLILFKSFFIEGPSCFHSTYKHCKNSQKTYQSLKRDCTEILELYKKNQENYVMFLNILNSINICDDQFSTDIFTKVINSVSEITEILFEILNIKAFTDSWKGYLNIIEKQCHILEKQSIYCVRELGMLSRQIGDFMEIVLENDNNKMKLQYIKLSGFLLKVAIKLMAKFWECLSVQYLQEIYQFVCSIYSFSLEWIQKCSLEIDIKHCIQTCLISVITPFVTDNIMSSSFIERLLSCNSYPGNYRGCIIMDMNILKYLNSSQENVECDNLIRFLNHICTDHSSYTSGETRKLELDHCILNQLCTEISSYIVNHEALYNTSIEKILLNNILSCNIYKYYIASSIWIDVLRCASEETRDEILSEFIVAIRESDSILHNSSKLIFLKNFVERIFIILTDEERIRVMEKYMLKDDLRFQNMMGYQVIDTQRMDSVIKNSFLKICDLENCTSTSQMVETMSTLKIIAKSNNISNEYQRDICHYFQSFWEYNYENVEFDNYLLEVIISKLSQATIAYMQHFPISQLCDILKRMKNLSLMNRKLIIYLCEILSSTHAHLTVYNMEQNRLNSVISDIFENLLTVDDEISKDLAFKTFHEFSINNYHIIVNNVLRMLPHIKLENYSKEEDEYNSFRDLRDADLTHKCLPTRSMPKSYAFVGEIPKSNFEHVRQNYIDNSKNYSLKTLPENNVNLRNIDGLTDELQNRNKRIKLTSVPQQEDDIVEILQRIKNEIKCLRKVLSRDSLTTRDAQTIKAIIAQLENILS